MNVTGTELNIPLEDLVTTINKSDIENYVHRQMYHSLRSYTETEYDTVFRFEVMKIIQYFKANHYDIYDGEKYV